MKRNYLISRVTTICIVFALSACAPLKQYRTEYDVCESMTFNPSPLCMAHALQKYRDANNRNEEFLLGFVEFNDQGLLFDRKQMNAVVSELKREAVQRDLLIVVFMHGWKHNARHQDSNRPEDENITTFRQVLSELSKAEARISEITGTPPRGIAGVYLGWRGASITAPLLKELTIWDGFVA